MERNRREIYFSICNCSKPVTFLLVPLCLVFYTDSEIMFSFNQIFIGKLLPVLCSFAL